MKNVTAGIPPVPLEECKRRAGEFGKRESWPQPASAFAEAIWPNHKMKPQGAGAAATRILKAMEKEGRAGWYSRGNQWGWWAK